VVQFVLVRCFSLRPSRVLGVLCVKDFFAAKQETVAILKLHHYPAALSFEYDLRTDTWPNAPPRAPPLSVVRKLVRKLVRRQTD
jgi:hypothetical protein